MYEAETLPEGSITPTHATIVDDICFVLDNSNKFYETDPPKIAEEKIRQTIETMVEKVGGWEYSIVDSLLRRVELGILERQNHPKAIEKILRDVKNKVEDAASFAVEKPYYSYVVAYITALTVLITLSPDLIKLLGFSEEGPIEGRHHQ